MTEEELRAWAEDHRPAVREAILDLFRRLEELEERVTARDREINERSFYCIRCKSEPGERCDPGCRS